MMKRLPSILLAAVLLLSSCGIYSFTGTSIQPDVNSICINYIEYKALKVNPTLSNELTEALRTRFRRMTRLQIEEEEGDLDLSGEVTGYDVAATAITSGDVAAQNRLTVTIRMSFINNKHPEDNFENKTFSAYSDYDSTLSLDQAESSLVAEIIEKLVEDIFNATVAQW